MDWRWQKRKSRGTTWSSLSKQSTRVTKIIFARNQFCTLYSAGSTEFYWVGASDVGRTAGDFYWRDGTKLDDELWGASDPNSFQEGKQTCVDIKYTDGKLYDYSCDAKTSCRPICHARIVDE
jgi:Lectin C-type domain